jgi:WD40 repeat protein
MLAIGGTYTIWLYAENLQPIKSLHTSIEGIHCLAWSSDSTKLAVGGDNSNAIQVWDIKAGQIVASFQEHTTFISVIAWKPKSSLITSVGFDDIRIWDGDTGKQVQLVQQYLEGGAITTLAWSQDGKRLLIVGVRFGIRIVSVPGARLLFALPDEETTTLTETPRPQTRVAAWSPDSSLIAIGYTVYGDSHAVKVLALSTRHVIAAFQKLETFGRVFALAWSPDGTKLAALRDDAVVHVWSVGSGQELTSYAGKSVNYWGSYPNALSWSPDGRRLASATDGNIVRVLDTKTYNVTTIQITEAPSRFGAGSS